MRRAGRCAVPGAYAMSAPLSREASGDQLTDRARVITRERVRNYSLIFLMGSVIALSTSTVAALVLSGAQRLPLPDFLAHWTGGKILADGLVSKLYDPAVQQTLQTSIGSPPNVLAWFVSPPFVAAVYIPFALLPYLAACAVWTGASLAMLGLALARLQVFAPQLWARERLLVVLAVLASYPVFELVGSGQDSALVLLVWCVGVGLSVRGRQVPAGLVFALGLVKPQLVVLVPVVFVLARQFRGLAAFLGGGVFFGAASVAVAGKAGVVSWIGTLTGGLYTDQVTVGQSWKMVSLPGLLSAVLSPAGHGIAWGAAAIATVAPVMYFILRGYRADPSAKPWIWTACSATTVVASPHLLVYDAVLLVPAALFCLEHLPTRGLQRLLTLAFCAAWLMPLAKTVAPHFGELGVVAAAPWVALPVVGLWWHVVGGASRSDSGGSEPA